MTTVFLIGAILCFIVIPGGKVIYRERMEAKKRAQILDAMEAERLRSQLEFLLRKKIATNDEELRKIRESQRQRPVRRKGVVTRGDVRRARELIAGYGGYKLAVKKTHPDYGGNARNFDAVIKAKKLVDRFPHVI